MAGQARSTHRHRVVRRHAARRGAPHHSRRSDRRPADQSGARDHAKRAAKPDHRAVPRLADPRHSRRPTSRRGGRPHRGGDRGQRVRARRYRHAAHAQSHDCVLRPVLRAQASGRRVARRAAVHPVLRCEHRKTRPALQGRHGLDGDRHGVRRSDPGRAARPRLCRRGIAERLVLGRGDDGVRDSAGRRQRADLGARGGRALHAGSPARGAPARGVGRARGRQRGQLHSPAHLSAFLGDPSAHHADRRDRRRQRVRAAGTPHRPARAQLFLRADSDVSRRISRARGRVVVQLSHARAFIIALALAIAATSGAAQVDSRVHQSAARLQPFTIRDTVYRRERSLWVYLPANYDAKRATPYPLLAASRAPAFIAVLIDNGERAERIADLGNAPRMVRFLGDQLIPRTRARWHVSTDPHQVIITGSSAGGLASAYAALMRPDLFGNVVSQSGAFWRGADASNDAPYEWLTAEVRRLPKRDVRFVLDVGELEDHATLGGAGPNFLDANRRFREALQAKGYDVVYTEVPGGQHAPIYWTPRLPVDLLTVTAAWHNGPHSPGRFLAIHSISTAIPP